ncbi:uncharacterized protein UTRI_04698 [Ustilago trichophora]|uniref:Uncharacterized protein n=1 Tax=Ustilago trichophora TaxID=86804 RepID=A0A5C3EF97_9BASI|nr:uncharacterized protein UTRI_04698 [Ustilago trichophora]
MHSIDCQPGDRWVVGGDFNVRNHPWSSSPSPIRGPSRGQVQQLIGDLGGRCITPVGMITHITHNSQTTIDLTVVGPDTTASNIQTLRLTMERDHLPITFFLEENIHDPGEQEEVPLTTPNGFGNLRKVNWASFATHLGQALAQLDRQPTNTLEWRGMVECLRRSVNKSRPCLLKKGKDHKRPLRSYWNDECETAAQALKAQRRETDEATRQRWLVSGSKGEPSRKELWRAQRKDPEVRQCMRALRRVTNLAKTDVVMERIGHLDGARGWTAVSILRGKPQKERTASPPLQRTDGRTAISPEDKVELLVQTIFPTIDVDVEPDVVEDCAVSAVDMPAVTVEELMAATQTMAPDKASGPDGVTPELLKQAIQLSSPFRQRFLRVINQFVQQGDMPADWRQASISVLPKPGAHRDLTLAKSYRPISLLNVASKVVDAIVTRRIHHLSSHAAGFLSMPHHFGSVPGVSTTDAIGTILEKGRNALRKKQCTALACIDVGGAFNNIDHEQLLSEVEARGQPELARWLHIWLRERTFIVRFEHFTSRRYALGHRGVPQGSPLSPILWTLYLDTFFQDPTVHGMERILMQGGYVDDLFVLAHGSTAEEAALQVQAWMDKLYGWCELRSLTLDKPSFMVDDTDSKVFWRMTLPPEGEQGMNDGVGELPAQAQPVQGRSVEPPTLRLMDGTRQRPEASVKILGITISPRMSTTEYVERRACSIEAMTLALGRSIAAAGGLTMATQARIVQAVCQASLDYACPALMPLTWRARTALTKADQAMLRLVFSASTSAQMPRAQAMSHELGWLTSEQRWMRLALRHTSKQLGAGTTMGAMMRQRLEVENAEGRRLPVATPSLLSETDIGVPLLAQHRQGKGIGGAGRGAQLRVGPWRWALQGQVAPVERVSPPITAPWHWKGPKVVIVDAEKARQTAKALQHRMPKVTTVVFTDGSRKAVRQGQAGVGAAAFGSSNHPIGTWTYRRPLPEERTDIFDAELCAIQLALQSCLEISMGQIAVEEGVVTKTVRGRQMGTKWKRIEVLSDSQAALQRLQAGWKRDRSAGQSWCIRIRELITLLESHNPGVAITLRWVPSHCGVEGNERADREANEAAEGVAAEELVFSQAKANQVIDGSVREWRIKMHEELALGHRVVSRSPREKPTKTYAGLRRTTARHLLLWRCNRIPSSREHGRCPECDCGHEERTREHLLLHCKLLEDQRKAVQSFFPPNQRAQLDKLLIGGEWRGEDEKRSRYLAALERLVGDAYRLRYPNDIRAARERLELERVQRQEQREFLTGPLREEETAELQVSESDSASASELAFGSDLDSGDDLEEIESSEDERRVARQRAREEWEREMEAQLDDARRDDKSGEEGS